jgi:DNA mismatch repair ATPase MutS
MEELFSYNTSKSEWKPVIHENETNIKEESKITNLHGQKDEDSDLIKSINKDSYISAHEYFHINDIQKAARVYESQLKEIIDKLTDIDNKCTNLCEALLNGKINKQVEKVDQAGNHSTGKFKFFRVRG